MIDLRRRQEEPKLILEMNPYEAGFMAGLLYKYLQECEEGDNNELVVKKLYERILQLGTLLYHG